MKNLLAIEFLEKNLDGSNIHKHFESRFTKFYRDIG